MRETGFRQIASDAVVRLASLAAIGLWSFGAAALDSKVVDPNVVRVLAFRGADQFVIGSAVAIGPTGLLLTTSQLVRNADRLLVLDGGLDIDRFGRAASLRAAAPDLDLAVIEAPGLQRPGLPISANAPAVGAKVGTVMFPGNVGPAAALPTPGTDAGTVAALVSAPLRGARPVALIEHDAAPKNATFPGPLVDDCSRIVGFTVTGGPSTPGSNLRVAVAGGELVRFLEAERLSFTKATAPCPASAATTAATQPAARPNPALVREAQVLLNTLGFDTGTPDGVIGPRTNNAVIAFQKSASLAPNRQIDDGLLKALRAAAAARAQPAPPPAPPAAVQPMATVAAPAAQPAPAASPPTAASVWPYALGGAGIAFAGAGLLVLVIWLRRRPAAPAPLERASEILRAARDARNGGGGFATELGEGRWVLQGSTPDGRAVHLLVDADTMAKTPEGMVIGRSAQLAELVLEHPSVSRSHARLTLGPGGLAIEDLQSTNGTHVNGVSMSAHRPMPLPEGALVTIGDVNMRLARA